MEGTGRADPVREEERKKMLETVWRPLEYIFCLSCFDFVCVTLSGVVVLLFLLVASFSGLVDGTFLLVGLGVSLWLIAAGSSRLEEAVEGEQV